MRTLLKNFTCLLILITILAMTGCTSLTVPYDENHTSSDYLFSSDYPSSDLSNSSDSPVSSNIIQSSFPAGSNYTPTSSADVSSTDERKVCYLTFDDGPSKNTGEILKILKEYNAKATFFVIGEGDLSYLPQIAAEGHAIGLHTDTHNYKKIYSSTDAYYKDLFAISDKVFAKTGIRTPIMRFPGGSSNTISRTYNKGIMTKLSTGVIEKGFQYYDWNVTSADADGTRVPKDDIVKSIKNATGKSMKKVCVLMHDAAPKTTTVDALPEILEFYRSNGYEFEALGGDSPTFHHRVNN